MKPTIHARRLREARERHDAESERQRVLDEYATTLVEVRVFTSRKPYQRPSQREAAARSTPFGGGT